jgi:hypothetical protein|tara:strand:- start:416 stop:592 length:177 start_codon:yes stop_codon:yes gene_type:complete
MKGIVKGDAVTFTNSAGRVITGNVTIVDGTWITVVETMGSAYKLPMNAVKLVGASMHK